MNLSPHIRTLILLITLLSFTLPTAPRAAAQTAPDNIGREFYFATPEIDGNATPGWDMLHQPIVYIASASNATANGTLEIADGSFAPVAFSVAPGGIATIEIPPDDRITGTDLVAHPHSAPDGVSQKSFRISSDNDISVYFLNFMHFSTDAAVLMPSDAVGTLYVIPAYTGRGNVGWDGYYMVVAQEDDTTITISASDGTNPPNGTPGSLPQLYISGANSFDESTQITLQAGEVYVGRPAVSQDLSGTVVRSDKPVAVFGGASCANVPFGFGSCDQLLDAVPAVDTWGTEFIAGAAEGRNLGDTFRVFAWADGTEVRFDGELIATLDAGTWLEYRRASTDAMHIETSLPVMAVRYFNGYEYDSLVSELGDPSMTVMQPLSQNRTQYTVTTPVDVMADLGGDTEYTNYIGIVAPDGVTVNLDGNPVTTGWSTVSDSGYRSTTIAVDPAAYTLSADEPFQLMVYGVRANESYAYIGGSQYPVTWLPAWGGAFELLPEPPIPTAEPTSEPRCDELPDMAVSPQFINLAPGGTATVEVALRNLCEDAPFTPFDLLVSLSDGLTVLDGSGGMLNLGQRAAWQQLMLKPAETRQFTLVVQAPAQFSAAPLHISELYYSGRVANRIDGVFITPAPAAEPAVVEAAVEPAPVVTAVPAALPTVLPNTAAPAGSTLPLLLAALGGLSGAVLLLRRR
jgi:hypothetical protein